MLVIIKNMSIFIFTTAISDLLNLISRKAVKFNNLKKMFFLRKFIIQQTG